MNWVRVAANTFMSLVNGALLTLGCWVLDVDLSSDTFIVGLGLVVLLTPDVVD